MVKKQQRENNRKRDPQSELMIDRHPDECIQKEKTRNRDQHRSGIIDIDGADEITLLALEFQIAMAAMGVHPERLCVQWPDAAARALEPQAAAEHRQDRTGHVYAVASSWGTFSGLLGDRAAPFM